MAMQDGETISEATKLPMERDEYDTTNSFGRNIDLLLKVKRTTVELGCNEWTSAKMKHFLLRQQSKNLRSNCSILGKLYVTSQGKVNKIMAADVVDRYGYLYDLELEKNMYIVTAYQPIFLPAHFNQLPLFKKPIKELFVWKDYLASNRHYEDGVFTTPVR